MKRLRLACSVSLVPLVLISLLAPCAAHAICYGDQAQASTPLVFSPVPQFPVPTLFARWAPVLEAVGKASGECFELVIQPTIPEFEKALLKGAPAIAYANPYHAVMAYKAKQYQPLLADGSTLLSGILVAKKDSNITQAADLQNLRVDFPSPNAFAASLLLRAHLRQSKIDIRPHYVNTHSNVYRGVLIGEAAAGGGVNRTLESEPEEIRQKLRVIYESPGYRSHPIITSPKVSAAIRDKILRSFIALEKTEQGRSLLAGVQLNQPIPVSYHKDYRPLEALNLEKLVVLDE